ncbi:MAG: glycogen synthase [Desulfobulbaceae bacterium]|nr:glycogen synthase [Candidatus Kapabacteria bacterium]MBS3999075.1 glycogen synthase [Desulfobulbaceae bacterium]
MNILLASTEVTPYAKAGGLADITASLPIEWQKYGQNPIIIMPKYGFIDVHKYGFTPLEKTLIVPMGYWTEFARLWLGYLNGSRVPIYLVEHNEYFDRTGIYGDPHEYSDNDRRFIFFSRAVFEAAKALNFSPHIIHAHDFHTAFTMAFLKSYYNNDPHFSGAAGVYTIHNLAYQGKFNPNSAMLYSGFGMKEIFPGSWFEQFGAVNSMKTGIMFADKITTVSPTYAKEIRYDYYSEGLRDELNIRGADLVGILNGVYYDVWNPETDKYITHNYNADSLHLKKANKFEYLKSFGLDESDNLDMPLIGMVTRLTEQKGIDLIQERLEHYLANNACRFTLLGTGESKYVDFFNYLKWKYPKNCFITIGYNENLSHKIFAASDFLLMPSRFEPCGLTQMYALKYGTVPIVRNTGGLADTVTEYIPDSGQGWGFSFWQYNGDDFSYAIRRALTVFGQEPHWDLLRKNCMARNYSSAQSALDYLKVFKWALEKAGLK